MLVGGFVFPMLGALYYWMPHLTGRKRFFKLGETAFWLLFVGFHGTFLLMHWVGLLGQRRRIDTYDVGSGWEVINLISSVFSFVMAIGFALIVIDVIVNAAASARGPRNPWGAGTLEWAMPIPPPPYNFASLPEVRSRDPLIDDGDLAVRLAKGEGYLGAPRDGLRETLTVDTASGRPDGIAVFPRNTGLPILMAFVTGCAFLGMLTKAYWMLPLAGAGVTALALFWAWGLGHRGDRGLQDAGRGLLLPFASETANPPGWWGSVFLLLADATFMGSLLFGYAFLWTVAPNWPPPEWAVADRIWIGAAVAGALVAPAAIRFAAARLGRRGGAAPGLVLALLGAVGLMTGALSIPLSLPDPTRHAYDATLWIIGGYALLHAALAALMSGFVIARSAKGFLSPRRRGEVRIARLWIDYAAFVTLVAMAAAYAPAYLS